MMGKPLNSQPRSASEYGKLAVPFFYPAGWEAWMLLGILVILDAFLHLLALVNERRVRNPLKPTIAVFSTVLSSYGVATNRPVFSMHGRI